MRTRPADGRRATERRSIDRASRAPGRVVRIGVISSRDRFSIENAEVLGARRQVPRRLPRFGRSVAAVFGEDFRLSHLGMSEALVWKAGSERGQNLMTAASQTPGEPAEMDALVALAQREHRAGRLAEAAAAYRKILALRPDIAEMYNSLANVLLEPRPARRRDGPIRASGGSQARPLPGARQPGQHPLEAGQARPGRGTV